MSPPFLHYLHSYVASFEAVFSWTYMEKLLEPFRTVLSKEAILSVLRWVSVGLSKTVTFQGSSQVQKCISQWKRQVEFITLIPGQ